jgi:hypothetical protein
MRVTRSGPARWVVFGGAGALALYWIVARALRISEVAELAAALAAKLGW